MPTNLSLLQLSLALSAMLFANACKSIPNPMSSNKPAASLPPAASFGKTKAGEPATVWTLKNGKGLVAKVTDYGATLVEMHVPDKTGKTADVVLGFDNVAGYQSDDNQYFGCTTGRVCNRIAKGKFTLNGKEYSLAINNDPNHLHGGTTNSLSKVMWRGAPYETKRGKELIEQGVVFTYTSAAGEEGYPGKLQVTVTYALTRESELRIDYEAKLMDAAPGESTPINLTNHAYFNLAGAGAATVLDHTLKLEADNFTPVDNTLIPTGEIKPVAGSEIDFRQAHRIGARIPADDTPWKGYDHNFVVNGKLGDMRLAATLKDPASGRVMEIHTREPGIQFYTGNFLKSQKGKGGKIYPHRSAICLETQHYPDSVNQPKFPSTIYKDSEIYRTSTIHKFRAE
ncbi:MAG: galactose mutarotase [Pedosphaera sp.]|nr:galactose mutarotase [Pedosphaera sp.]MSU42546.1 galactose mutarotase [Pedosphaera sp.]